jgi:hypothetical protein
VKIIAYYLPQFHPVDENNTWWGSGFTEWTNVGKAKKYFRDHYQPKVPKDLGYYDLRISEVRNQQAELAKRAGVDAFCYWHYWFGNGRRLLEMPFNEVLKSGEPDFPFCLGWANESWKAKVWDSGSSKRDRILIEQQYPGEQDQYDHFYVLLDAFRDVRYFRVKGKPVFVIYKPFLMPDVEKFIATWNDLARKENISDGFHFIGHTDKSCDISPILKMGFNAVNIVRNGEQATNKELLRKIIFPALIYKIFRRPLKIEYSLISKYFIQDQERNSNIYPSIIPNWDHTPRSGRKGTVYHNSTPELFAKHVSSVLEVVKKKEESDQIIFLKSWNEWGEGNYMEPDLRFGMQYIDVLGKLLRQNNVH